MSSEQRSFAADTPVVNFNDKLELPMKKDQVNIHPTETDTPACTCTRKMNVQYAHEHKRISM